MMGYSIAGLGGVIASGSSAFCGGGQYGYTNAAGTSIDKGTICPADTWSEYTLRGIAGPVTWYHELERRIVSVLSLMTEESLADEAWNRGFEQDVLVDNSFIAAIDKARNNFNRLYPASRWTSQYVQVPFKVTYWRSAVVQNNPDIVAVYNSILGKQTTEQDRKDFDAKTYDVVTSLPRPTSSLDPMGLPFLKTVSIIDGIVKKDFPISVLLLVDGNKLVPNAWFRKFLDLYAPNWSAGATGTRKIGTLKRSSLSVAKRLITTGTQRSGSTATTQASGSGIWIVAVVSVAVASGIYWYTKKKSR